MFWTGEQTPQTFLLFGCMHEMSNVTKCQISRNVKCHKMSNVKCQMSRNVKCHEMSNVQNVKCHKMSNVKKCQMSNVMKWQMS